MGAVVEAPAPQGGRQAIMDGKGRESNELRTVMEEMDVGEKEMEKW